MDIPVSPGDILLGKYRIEHILGQGGMGAVVAARHIELEELFAIKFLLPSMLAYAEILERFVREARAAARLRTEHVARVHDVGRLPDGTPYMVMEYLDGCDLKALVRQKGPLSVEDVIAYLIQVCEAIGEAHDAGIIHRDLKPANLFLIQRPSGKPCIKVLDFGISKQSGRADSNDLTGTGAILGSPAYMSPEQMIRSKTVDFRTDIWAMGVILYELLTGTQPFKGQAVTEMVASILQEEPIPPCMLRPSLPKAIEVIVLRCLRKAPNQRFQSVIELRTALEDVPSSSPISGVKSTIPLNQETLPIDTAQVAKLSVNGESSVAMSTTDSRSYSSTSQSLGGIHITSMVSTPLRSFAGRRARVIVAAATATTMVAGIGLAWMILRQQSSHIAAPNDATSVSSNGENPNEKGKPVTSVVEPRAIGSSNAAPAPPTETSAVVRPIASSEASAQRPKVISTPSPLKSIKTPKQSQYEPMN